MNSSLRINVWIVPYLRDDSCFKVAAWWAWWLTVCAPPAEHPPLPELCLFFDWLVQYNCIIVLQLQANCDNTVVMGQIGFFDSILYRLLFWNILTLISIDIRRISWVECVVTSVVSIDVTIYHRVDTPTNHHQSFFWGKRPPSERSRKTASSKQLTKLMSNKQTFIVIK